MSLSVFALEADSISTAQSLFYYKSNRYITNIMFELQQIA